MSTTRKRSSALTLIVLVLAEKGRAQDATWTSPSLGDVFAPGDTIVGKWISAEEIPSPSFRLCMSPNSSELVRARATDDDDRSNNCGADVWPIIEQNNGTYFISIGIPAISTEEAFILRMTDDSENTFESPSFSLRPISGSSHPHNASSKAAGASDSSAVPSQASTISIAASVTTQSLADTTLPAKSATSTLESASSSGKPASAAPLVLANRSSHSTVAWAVPLSVFGAILILSGLLAWKQNRRIVKERALDAEKLKNAPPSRQSSTHSYKSTYSSSNRMSEVERALNVQSRNDLTYGSAAGPVPLFMPVEEQRRQVHARRSSRQAYQISVDAVTPLTRATNNPRSVSTRSRNLIGARQSHTPVETVNRTQDDRADVSLPCSSSRSTITVPEQLHTRNGGPSLSSSSKLASDASASQASRGRNLYGDVARASQKK